jgi:glutamate/tyrosine decarboxylase-like PLP-dependent enzyme
MTEQVACLTVPHGNPRLGGYDPAAILGEWIVALTNTSMYTYEVAPVVTLMEVELVRRMNDLVGLEDCEGVLAPAGSLSNLMGVLVAATSGTTVPGAWRAHRPAMRPLVGRGYTSW